MQQSLLLLPGMLCDTELWSHQTEHLLRAAEVRVADLTTEETISDMALSVLEAAPQRFALAGLSMGGIVAMNIVRCAPERVERLALFDTTARPPRKEQLELWREMAAMSENGGFEEVVEKWLLPAYFHSDDQENATLTELTEVAWRMALNVGPEAFVRQLSAQAGRPDIRSGLGDITCPTLVAVGRQDRLCPLEVHEEISSAIDGSVLVAVQDCGHLSSLERPQAITALLEYWLQKG